MRILFSFALIVSVSRIHAQTEKRFFNEWGELTSKDSSTYYRTWLIEKQKYNDYTYYTANNQVKAYEPKYEGSLNGEVVYFHPNGQVHLKVNYLRGIPFGTVTSYYPNGKIQKIISYDSAKSLELKSGTVTGFVLLQYYDSIDNQLVKDGNGIAIEYTRNRLGLLKFIGKVSSGLKDSIQTMYFPNGKLYYQEEWKMGEFIKGIAFDESEKATEYSELESFAKPNGGMAAFYKFIGEKLRYPLNAKRAGTEGRVFVEFVVEKDGSLSDAKVVRGISPDCDQEALRLIKIAPKWKPGLQRGRPVRSKFNLAIIFKLT